MIVGLSVELTIWFRR